MTSVLEFSGGRIRQMSLYMHLFDAGHIVILITLWFLLRPCRLRKYEARAENYFDVSRLSM